MRLLCPALDTTVFGTLRAMDKAKKSNPTFKKPDFAAMRQAVASSTAIETGQSIHVLEQKLKIRRSVVLLISNLQTSVMQIMFHCLFYRARESGAPGTSDQP